MWKMFFLVLLLLPLQLINAQVEKGAYWGVSINVESLNENNNAGRTYEILPPPELYLHLGYNFNQYIRAEVSGGYIFTADNWDGFDLGAALKSQIINKLFISAGINYNSIAGGGGEEKPLYYQKDFVFGSIGLGYYVTSNASIELNYSKPLNSDRAYGYNNSTNRQLELYSKLKLGFCWNFSF